MNNVKKLRAEKGLTQDELAKKLGMTRTGLLYVEQSKSKKIFSKTIKSMCDFFNVSEVQLLGLDVLNFMPKSKEDCQYLIDLLEKEKQKYDN